MNKTPPPSIDDLKRQLADLDDLVAHRAITDEAARTTRQRIEREVLNAVLRPQVPEGLPPVPAPMATRTLMLWIVAFVLVFGSVGYAWRGNFTGLARAPGQAAPAATVDPAAGHQDEAQIESMLQHLADRLKTEPDDAAGWSMLARSYSARGRFEEALPAYKRVVELHPQDAQALADYADGLASAHEHNLSGEPAKLVAQALLLDPNNVKALSLAGTIAFDKADFTGAADRWQKAISASDPASDFTRQLRAALAEARQRAGLPQSAATDVVAPAASAPATTSQAAAVITGRVSVSATLASKVAPDDTVFIYARTATGSKMPLAILRKKGSDLPLDFTLDDTSAMSPATRLSSATQVIVSARVSKSGDAMPQPGDLEATSAVIAVGTHDLKVVIGDVKK